MFPKPDYINCESIRLFFNVFVQKKSAIFGEIDAWRLFVISAPKPRNFDLCVSGAVRSDFDVVQSSEICAHAVSLRVRRFRALVAVPFLSFERCTCAVHVCACSLQSVASCACAVFFLRAVDRRLWSTGNVRVCGELVVAVSLCLRVCF